MSYRTKKTMSTMKTAYSLGVIQNCRHFHESTQSMLGGGGQWPLFAFLNVDASLHFHTRSLEINIFKNSFGR